MAINLNKLSNLTTTSQSLGNIIIATPQVSNVYQPQNPNETPDNLDDPLPNSFVFHYETENIVTLESDVTDHYTEDNSTVQDQIALKPETIQTVGYIGELNNILPPQLAAVRLAATKLYAIVDFKPELTVSAQIAQAKALQSYQAVAKVTAASVAAWSNPFGSGNTKTKQEIAFQEIYGYWLNRTLFTVQTPWGKFSDCAIMSVRAVQAEDSTMISDFTVLFKKIRFAKTKIISATRNVMDGRSAEYSNDPSHMISSPKFTMGLSEGLANV